jgi:hypothetical protein
VHGDVVKSGAIKFPANVTVVIDGIEHYEVFFFLLLLLFVAKIAIFFF